MRMEKGFRKSPPKKGGHPCLAILLNENTMGKVSEKSSTKTDGLSSKVIHHQGSHCITTRTLNNNVTGSTHTD